MFGCGRSCASSCTQDRHRGGRGHRRPELEGRGLGALDEGRPGRDVTLVENTPIDYLDFASPVSGLGSKMGIDATAKWPGETEREWGRPYRHGPGRARPGRRDVGEPRDPAAGRRAARDRSRHLRPRPARPVLGPNPAPGSGSDPMSASPPRTPDRPAALPPSPRDGRPVTAGREPRAMCVRPGTRSWIPESRNRFQTGSVNSNTEWPTSRSSADDPESTLFRLMCHWTRLSLEPGRGSG